MALLPRDANFGDPWSAMNHFFLGTQTDCTKIYHAGPSSINAPSRHFHDSPKTKLRIAKQFKTYVRTTANKAGVLKASSAGRRQCLKVKRTTGGLGGDEDVFLEQVTIDDTEILVWAWITEKMLDGVSPNTIRKYLNAIAWVVMVICGVNSVNPVLFNVPFHPRV